MTDLTTLSESTRTIDGTELVRVATSGNNWKTTVANLVPGVLGTSANTQILYNSLNTIAGDPDLTWTAGATGGSFGVSPGGLNLVMPSDYSQFTNIYQYTSSYLNMFGIGNSANTGIAFGNLDASGNNGVAYFFANSDELNFQSPYITATTHFGLIKFTIGQLGGGSLTGLVIRPDAAGQPYVQVYGHLDTLLATYTAANGANNNIVIPLVPGGAAGQTSMMRIAGPTGVFNITGFAGGTEGRHLWIYNTTTQNMTITNKATSTAGNQINTMTGADVALTGECMAHFIYDTVTSFWLLAATQG